MPPTRNYRSALQIIQLMLEELIRVGEGGIVKSTLYRAVRLKTAVGEKYLSQIQKAQYIVLEEEKWGKERFRHKVYITQRGMQRFQWFIRLSNELNL